MTGFEIDTTSATSVATGLENEETNIIKYLNDTITTAEEMANTWKGTAPATYQQAKITWDAAIKKMDVGMARACQILRQNISSYHTTDEDLAGMFKNFNV